MSDDQHLRIRINQGSTVVIGPGKADLLEAIEQYGSISAAARHMRMSYRRAWELVDEMNKNFTQLLVASSPGGHQGGGAQLTEFGRMVLLHYRAIETKSKLASSLEIDFIASHLKAPE